MTFKLNQSGLKKKMDPKGSAGKILGKAGEDPPRSFGGAHKVLGAKGKKRPPFKRKGPAKKGQPAGKHKPPPWMHVAKGK
jgi:hypothetical protein